MNTDELIESIHTANAERRLAEHESPRPAVRRLSWAWALPLPAAAVLLLLLLTRGNAAQAATPAPGVYCNSQCNPDDVMALIDNQINHIKTLRTS